MALDGDQSASRRGWPLIARNQNLAALIRVDNQQGPLQRTGCPSPLSRFPTNCTQAGNDGRGRSSSAAGGGVMARRRRPLIWGLLVAVPLAVSAGDARR